MIKFALGFVTGLIFYPKIAPVVLSKLNAL